MISALNESNERVIASDVEKDDSIFRCSYCDEDTILKKGKKRIHHFSHKSDSGCEFSGGESQEHMKAKMGIYGELSKHDNVKYCAVEYPFKELGVRPDVIFSTKNGIDVVIEIQKSTIDIDTIQRRMDRYKSKNINVIWILLPTDKTTINAKGWQKYLHGMCYGKVYYWSEGAMVNPCHYMTEKVWVEGYDKVDNEKMWEDYQSDYEGMSWSDYKDNKKDEYIEEVGGYFKLLKNRKTLNFYDKSLHLVDDFGSKQKPSWNRYPETLVWLDNTRSWWP